jgi:hypothetical protein
MRLSSSPKLNGLRVRTTSSRETAAVLLEVVLALVLFVAAATVLTSALSSSLDGVERLRLETRASDLAVSVISELQLGIKTLSQSGPQPFGTPLEGWTWEVVSSQMQTDLDETNQFKKIEVIIRHEDPALVYRLNQVLQLDEAASSRDTKLPGVSSF